MDYIIAPPPPLDAGLIEVVDIGVGICDPSAPLRERSGGGAGRSCGWLLNRAQAIPKADFVRLSS